MAYLDLDTDILRSTVSVAKQTNDSISEALEFLKEVVTHNDWQCSEREAINSNTDQNRETASEIQQQTSAFYRAIKQASEEFDAAEQGMIGKVNQVDSWIAQIVNVVPGITDAGSAAVTLPNMADFASIMSSMEG